MATWPSGKARVCKTLIPSSILGVASKDLTRVRSFFYVRTAFCFMMPYGG